MLFSLVEESVSQLLAKWASLIDFCRLAIIEPEIKQKQLCFRNEMKKRKKKRNKNKRNLPVASPRHATPRRAAPAPAPSPSL
jgi:hypothetical protein